MNQQWCENFFFLRLFLTLCCCKLAKWLWHFQWSCIVSLEASLNAPEVWGLWLMLKAFAPVTWRKEIRARCQQISTSTWLTRQTPLCVCVCVCVHSLQSHTQDSGATQVIFQWWFYVNVLIICLQFSEIHLKNQNKANKNTHTQGTSHIQ